MCVFLKIKIIKYLEQIIFSIFINFFSLIYYIMPSLADGTSWRLAGRNILRASPATTTSATYTVNVVSADDIGVTWSNWDGSSTLTGGLGQQSVEISVAKRVGTVTTTTTYKGIFAKNQAGLFSAASSATQGFGLLYDDNGNAAYFSVVTNTNVNSGRQSLLAQFHDSSSYSTLTGFTARS